MSLPADYDTWRTTEPDGDTVIVDVDDLDEQGNPSTEIDEDDDRLFRVEVCGYDSVTVIAESKDAARYRAFKAFREAFGHTITFGEFLARGVKVRAA